MPFQPIKFDESVARTEGVNVRVPEGYYLVETIEFQPTPEDYAKTTGVYFTARIVEVNDHAQGVGVGRTSRRYCSLGGKEGSQFAFGAVLRGLGQQQLQKQFVGAEIPSYKAFVSMCANLTQRLAGKRTVALFQDQAGTPSENGPRVFSSMEDFFPESEWAAYKTLRMGAPTSAITGQPVTGAPRMASAQATGEIMSEIQGMFSPPAES